MSDRDPPDKAAPANDEAADDQQWFDLMAGRSVSDVRPATRNEAAWLRAALLAYAPAPPAGDMPDPAARARQLVEKARRAGVLQEPSPPAAATARPGWLAWLRQPWFAGGAGLAIAAVLAVVVLRVAALPVQEPEVERGAAIQQLQAEDPVARQQALLQALRAAGLDAQPYEQLGRLGVDLALPVPLPPTQAAALAAQGLRPPVGPSLRVEIVGAAAASSATSAASAARPGSAP